MDVRWILCCIAFIIGKFERSSAIEDNSIYTYDYDGRIATGVTQPIQQFSGFAIKAKLSLRKQEEYTYFQFSDIEVGNLNRKVDENLNEKFRYDYSDSKYKSQTLIDNLQKPFRVSFDKGLVKSFYTSIDEPEWSINIKKAVLSLFQLNLESKKEEKYFIFEEESINGICETNYNINDKLHPGYFSLSKIRFLDKCLKDVRMLYANVWGKKCRSRNYKEPIKRLSYVDYIIKGNRQNFVIERITAVGETIFLPSGEETQHLLSAVNQSLVLINQGKSQQKIPFPDKSKKHDSLQYNFAISRRGFTDHRYYNRLADFEYKEAFDKAGEVFDLLLEEYSRKISSVWSGNNLSEKIIILINYLSALNEDQLLQFFLKYVQLENAGTIFSIALPMIGTTSSNLFLIELQGPYSVCNKISDKRCKEISFKSIDIAIPFFMKQSSLKVIEEYRKNFIVSDKNMFDQRDSLLTYGSILYRSCYCPFSISSEDPQDADYVNEKQCTTYVEEIIQFYHKEAKSYIKDAYLRALINTRSPEAFKIILSAINDKDAFIARITAIQGLLNFQEPEQLNQIKEAMEKLIEDNNEHYVLRTYAYEILVKIVSNKSYLTNLVIKIFTETNQQLTTYLYDILDNIANSNDFCTYDVEIVNHLKILMKYVEHPQASNAIFSGQKSLNLQTTKLNYGRQWTLGWIGSNSTVFPRELNFEENFDIYGYKFNLLKIGFSNDDFWHMDVFIAGLVRLHNLLDVPVFDRDIQEKLINLTRPMVERKSPLSLNSHKNLRFQFVFLDQHLSIEGGAFQEVLQRIKMFFNSEINYVVPNDMGFPVSLDFNMAYNSYFRQNCQKTFNVTSDKGALSFDLCLQIAISSHSLVHTRMAVIDPFANAFGFAVTTRTSSRILIYGNATFLYNITEKEFNLNYEIPSKPLVLYTHKSKPYSFIYNLAEILPDENKVLPLQFLYSHPEIKYRVGHSYFGIGLQLNVRNQLPGHNVINFLQNFVWNSKTDESILSPSRLFLEIVERVDFLFFNPSLDPLELDLLLEPDEKHPTEEFQLNIKHNTRRDIGMLAVHKPLDLADSPDLIINDIKISLTAKGATARNWQTHYRWSTMYPKGEPGTSNFVFERSPLPDYDPEKFQMRYQRRSQAIKFNKINEDTLGEMKEIHALNLDYGPKAENEIQFRLTFEKSDEQKDNLLKMSTKQLFKECKTELYFKKLNSECWKKASGILSLNKALLKINFTDRSSISNVLTYLSFFEEKLFYNVYKSFQRFRNPENQIYILANISEFYPIVDVTISSPNENIYFYNAFLSSVFHNFHSFFSGNLLQKYTKSLIKTSPYASCKISHTITTFDNVRYTAELTKCYHLLAMDCSYTDSFGVLGRSATNSIFSQAIKILLRNHTIDLIPNETKDPKKGTMALIVNGIKKADPKFQRYVEMNPEDKTDRIFEIYYYMGHYIAQLYQAHVQVDLAETYVDIQVSHLYRGRMCGICGDFNLDDNKEFLGSDMCVYKDIKTFLLSYVVGFDRCAVPKINECENYLK